jgi:HEAT repeat protein
MLRLVLALVFATASVVVGSRPADAHGGNFRGPNGAVPPGLRPPGDPTPPPPPPPPSPPPTGEPTETPNVPPPHEPPPTPPTGNPYPELPETSGNPRKTATIGFENWTFWWGYNKDDILNLKEAIYRLRITRDHPFGGGLGLRQGNLADATRLTDRQVKDIVIPALLWAMDPANRQHPDTESAAYLALAKVTDDPAHVRRIKAAVVDRTRDQIVRESAALALGLLRRGEGRRGFDARELDGARDFCFDVFSDAKHETRTRAFAMYAVGLLGDQPTDRGAPASGETGGAPASARIWELLKAGIGRFPDPDLPVALLLALSLQREDTVPPHMTEALAACAVKGRLFKEDVPDLVQAHAALALGRVGDDLAVEPMLNALTLRSTSRHVKYSAAIALGRLGRRVDGPRRAQIAKELVKAIDDASDASTKNFAIVSLAYLVSADVASQRTDVVDSKARVADTLVAVAEKGAAVQRPFGALALGLIGRAIGERPDLEVYGRLRGRIEAVLREGLSDPRLDKRTRGGFAISLGLLGDAGSVPTLAGLVSRPTEDPELRGYSAVALGMIGDASRDVVRALVDALRERSSEELRLQCATGLGLLSQPGTVPLLAKELDEADTQAVQGQIVLALAKIGDAGAVAPLVDLLKNPQKPDLTRALATAGLGLVGDLEPVPSLVRISKDVNYRATTNALDEVLTIL